MGNQWVDAIAAIDTMCELVLLDAGWLDRNRNVDTDLRRSKLVFRSPLDQSKRWTPVGEISVPVKLTDSNENELSLNQDFVVTPLHDLRYDILLGTPFLQKVDVTLDFRNKRWVLHDEPVRNRKWESIAEVNSQEEFDRAKSECVAAIRIEFGDELRVTQCSTPTRHEQGPGQLFRLGWCYRWASMLTVTTQRAQAGGTFTTNDSLMRMRL